MEGFSFPKAAHAEHDPRMTQTAKLRSLVCARCGAAFGCGAETGMCWCMEEELRVPMPKDASAACLCADCLRKLAAVTPPPRRGGSAR